MEAHFGVPLAGGVLVPLNFRLGAGEIAYILNHSGSKFLFVDSEFGNAVRPILGNLEAFRRVVDILDTRGAKPLGEIEYEDFLRRGNPKPVPSLLKDEDELISLNYTSGTAGKPEGVMLVHRGAYLNALAEIIETGLTSESKYLWTLPMFHCNGWCFTWAVSAIGATHVCLRKFEAGKAWHLIVTEGVTLFCGSPIVMAALINHHDRPKSDGQTIGEVVMRGSSVMKGYYKEPEATAKDFRGGWFHSGDLAVVHPDGYIELHDRLRDIIITGGENVSSNEIEQTLYIHPAVAEAAVVGVPHQKLGETAKAFVVLKEGVKINARELIKFCREKLASFKIPTAIEFKSSLPRTSSGKIQKFLLREKEWAGDEKRIQGV